MRIPLDNENLIGKICVSSVGRVAIVVGRKTFAWIGIGFDGKGTWVSTHPCVVDESAKEFHDRLFDRFGGKMSFNG